MLGALSGWDVTLAQWPSLFLAVQWGRSKKNRTNQTKYSKQMPKNILAYFELHSMAIFNMSRALLNFWTIGFLLIFIHI